MARRNLSDAERRLWREVTRDVQAAAPPPPLPETAPPSLPQPALPSALSLPPPKPRRQPSLASIFEDWHEKRLQQGSLKIEARLDLHGMTQNAAHAALIRFVLAEARAGKRLLLVITGKGRQGEGVLKHYVPVWLAAEPLRPWLQAVRPALPRHGGEGALYLLLRRQPN